MATQYIKVAESPEEDEAMEVPCETDNTVLLTTLTSVFPGACGLKYRNADSGTMRGLRLTDGKLQAPDEGWSVVEQYYCCFPKADNKRKLDDQEESAVPTKVKRYDEKKCSDLIVLGLAWKTTDKELREYFEETGELLMAQVKKDTKTGQSKGFGFIRFADFESQVKAITKRHCIDGRWCDVRIPLNKDGAPGGLGMGGGGFNAAGGNGTSTGADQFCRKIFIGRITSEITVDDLREYFNKYGDISDIFIPKPFRGFAFVTFSELSANQEVTPELFGDDHIIKGISVHVSHAVPKAEMNYHHQAPPHNPYGSSPYGGGGPYGGASSHHNSHHHNPHPPNPYVSGGSSSSSSKPYGRYSSYNSSSYSSGGGGGHHGGYHSSHSNNGSSHHYGSHHSSSSYSYGSGANGNYGNSSTGSNYSPPPYGDQYGSGGYGRGPPIGGGYGSKPENEYGDPNGGAGGGGGGGGSMYSSSRSRYAVGDGSNSYGGRDYYQ